MRCHSLMLAGLLWSTATLAQDIATDPGFAVTSGEVRVTVKSWGPDCGDKPKSTRDRAGTLYDFKGGQFLRRGKARKIDEPGICRSATGLPMIIETQEANGFRCKSPKGKGTQAFGRVSRKVDGDRAVIKHTFEYTWRLHGSQCEVDQRGKWVLQRKTAAPPKAPSDACATAGPAARLVPKMATTMNVRPRSSTRLRAVALDQNNCVSATPIKWRTTHGRIKGERLVLSKVKPDTVVKVTGKAGSANLTLSFNVSDTRNLSGLAPVHPGFARVASGQDDNRTREKVRVAMTVDTGSTAGRPTQKWGLLASALGAIFLGALCIGYARRLRARTQEDPLDELV